jgi:hypothetical protein
VVAAFCLKQVAVWIPSSDEDGCAH